LSGYRQRPRTPLSGKARLAHGNPTREHTIAMDERILTRREAIKKAALAGLLIPLASTATRLAAGDAAAPSAGAPTGLVLGLAGYSLRKLSTEEAIRTLNQLQIKNCAVFKVHVPILISTPDVCREMAQKFRSGGITLTSTGVVKLSNSEAVMRRAFECGKAAGLAMMTASYDVPPDRDTLLLTERFVREYDMKLAFHNHGPEDEIFPSPYDVWKAVQPYDERMGLCIDVGHSARAGVDPTEAILKCRSRLYDVHIKDTVAGVGVKKDQPVGLGFGRLDIRSIMAALIEIRFPYQVGLEDEVESADTIPGMAQSFGYMRGMVAGLAPGRPAA
jgi:sugar phosphate isomerase/epimerase